MNTGEFIPLSERTRTSRENTIEGRSNAETAFNTKSCGRIGAASTSSSSDPTYDLKHEKKVTFARLLNKVSVFDTSYSSNLFWKNIP